MGCRVFDFEKLREVTRVVTRNLNKIIDINYYPVETAKRSNLRHRPIGIGVQGLADTFLLLGMPFDSEQATQLNKDIFETIYFAALETSSEIAKIEGEPPSQRLGVTTRHHPFTCHEERILPAF